MGPDHPGNLNMRLRKGASSDEAQHPEHAIVAYEAGNVPRLIEAATWPIMDGSGVVRSG
jgi:hypothetical protein